MFEKTNGSRAEVWHGTAKKTPGGLTKSDLLMNKHGRIVSRKKHNTAKREKRLVKAGYLTKKGQFGFIKKGKGSKKMRGGTGAPMGAGMQGTPAGNAMAGKAMPMPNMDKGMNKGMMKGGNAMMMDKHMMMKGGNAMMMDKDMMMKGGNAMMMHKGMMKGGNAMMMDKHMMMKGGNAMMMHKGMMKGGMNHPSHHHGYAHHASAHHKGGRGTMKMMKGGMYALSPSPYDGQGVGTSGADLQIMATQMS